MLGSPHSLLVQSYAPADMRGGGTVNVDGFGVGWFAEDGYPTRYRRPSPIWTDSALPRLLDPVRTAGFVAAVRSGTPGMPVTEAACAPFGDDDWLFSHNGVVLGWPESVSPLAEELPVTDLLRLEAPTDSALLWSVLRRRLRDADPVDAVVSLLRDLDQVAPGSRLNLLLLGRDVLVASASSHALSVLWRGSGVLVASEPCAADPEWRSIPDGCLVVAQRDERGDASEPKVLSLPNGTESV